MKVKLNGVYFLYDKEQLVYIGESDNIFRRVAEHIKNKTFDSWEYIECSGEKDRKDLEAMLIKIFKPKYNEKIEFTYTFSHKSSLGKDVLGAIKIYDYAKRIYQRDLKAIFQLDPYDDYFYWVKQFYGIMEKDEYGESYIPLETFIANYGDLLKHVQNRKLDLK